MNRNTYVEINLTNVLHNVKQVINKFNNYEYYFGVVKADCYGHGSLKTVDSIIKGGVNYLAVALLEEGLYLRKEYKDIPILCLGMIKNENVSLAIKNNITITIINKNHLDSLDLKKLKKGKVHIKINTGMNRLGVSSKDEFNYIYNTLKFNNIYVEGIYSHIHSSDNNEFTNQQFNLFKYITSDIDLSKIKIVHIQASDALTGYNKLDFVNGCRLGIIIYGFTKDKDLDLKSTFKLYSEVIQINNLKKGDTLGYNHSYMAQGLEKIAVIPIGYADGILRKNNGGNVYINGLSYNIIGNICMDMLFVQIDENVKVFDKVEIIKDIEHIEKIANMLDTISYEVLCTISNRVPRIYIKNDKY